jgi:hypothetical protein
MNSPATEGAYRLATTGAPARRPLFPPNAERPLSHVEGGCSSHHGITPSADDLTHYFLGSLTS